jgi:hypothetical protein
MKNLSSKTINHISKTYGISDIIVLYALDGIGAITRSNALKEGGMDKVKELFPKAIE